MKKTTVHLITFCVCVCLLAFTTTSNAQVVFSQDFEAGIAPMTLVNNDGKTPATNVAAYTQAWNVVNPAFGNGTNIAVSNSWYTPAAAADDWMITPAITITSANTVLSWEAKAVDPAYPDGYQVRISKTTNALASFTDVVFSVPSEAPDWTPQGVSLAAYVGQTIYIAFRNNSNDQFLLAVDNIVVANILEKDVEATKFLSTEFNLAGSNASIVAEIKNTGSQILNTVDFTWTDGVNTYTENVTGLGLEYGQSTILTHGTTYSVVDPKQYNITVTFSNPNGGVDGFLENNEVSGSVVGVTYIPTKKMFVEEATGTWCTWCPRGAEWMDYMTETYPDEFIGVAVHNDDPMVVTEYDAGLTTSPGFSGFPSVLVDRNGLWDPSELEIILPDYIARIAPVSPILTADVDVATRKFTANTTTQFVTELNDLDYRLNIVLTEDDLSGTTADWAQVNSYGGPAAPLDPIPGFGLDWDALPNPVPAAQMQYDHVGRAILGGWAGYDGSIPASTTAGQIVTKQYVVNDMNTNWNPFKMHAVVMVIDNKTGIVLNANNTDVNVKCPTDFAVTLNLTNDSPAAGNTGAIAPTVANPNFGFGGYTFSLNGTVGTTFTALAPANNYTLVVSDKIGCTQAIPFSIITSGVQDIASLASVSLTPNVASTESMLNVRFTESVDMKVQVVNIEGKVMETAKYDNTTGTQHRFDVANYAAGTYFVHITVGNQVRTERLIIAR